MELKLVDCGGKYSGKCYSHSPQKMNSFFLKNERQKLDLYLPVTEFLGTYPTEIKSYMLGKKAWELMFTAALFIA